ncbi:MAG: response regulator [Cyanobacteria bacterium P01_D01_bin.1]
MKVLVVEDDKGLSEHLAQALAAHHYQVEIAADGETGLNLLEQSSYDLVLLDLCLPNVDGIDLCQQIRTEGNDVPIVLMTAEQTSANRISGLDAGADDCIVKPPDIDELLARMRAVMRRSKSQILPLLVWADVCLDPSSCEVLCPGQRLHLTKKECELLELLLRNPRRVFSLSALIERLWALERTPSENTVRAHVNSVRQKLKQAGVEGMIETVYGLGYRLTNQTTAALLEPPRASQSAVEAPKAQSPAQDPFRAAWERHQSKYLKLIDSLSEAIPGLQNPDLTAVDADRRALARSQTAIHTLKGTLGSFGFVQSSQIASQIEVWLHLPLPLTQAQVSRLQSTIDLLKQSIESLPAAPNSQSATTSSAPLSPTAFSTAPVPTEPVSTRSVSTEPALTKHSVAESVIAAGCCSNASLDQSLSRFSVLPNSVLSNSVVYEWLIIDKDRQKIELLLRKASMLGIQTQVASSFDEAHRRLVQHVPAVVTFDLDCAASWEKGIAFLSELTRQYPSLPIVAISDEDSLDARVNIARSGGCTFLRKSANVAQILETVTHIIFNQQSASARIVALDDNPQMLACLQHLLRPWGFQLTLLSDPAQFWQALEQTLPDLLILDIEMPNLNGLELCQVIRSDPRTAQIPILFLSAHTGPDIIRQVFEVGADDYISKPIVGPELIGRILNRLDRLRLLRKLAEIDSLTGLSRRRQSVKTLDQLLSLSIRNSVPLCMAILDLDNFKQINDRYGHDIGDQVLKVFGEYLRNAFRDEDVIARWGGEEFVVGLYDVSKELAMGRLNALRENFGQHLFQAERRSPIQTESPTQTKSPVQTKSQIQFQVSLSGGLVTAPADGDTIETLYHYADQALYRAKAAGRNQIHSYS